MLIIKSLRKIYFVLFIAILFTLYSPILFASDASIFNGQLEVHFIDVGQGDAILIRTPSHSLLIDGGERNETVLNYLRIYQVPRIDLMISTHAHADHIGGLIPVLEKLEVGEIIDPAVVHTSKTFEDYLTLIDRKNISFIEGRVGLRRRYGDKLEIEILHPLNPRSSHLNSSSIVAKLNYGEISFLFTGDAESAVEREIISRSAASLSSTFIKIGHHGSSTSTSSLFLSNVDPEVAFIMVGEGNSYGHPEEEVLMRLHNQEVEVFRTDIHGSIVVLTDGKTYHIKTQYISDLLLEEMVFDRVSVNRAAEEDLKRIIHINEVRAKSLIELRPFSSLKDLERIPGIGPSRVNDIIAQGLAYIDS